MALRSTEGIPKPTREPNIRGHNVSPGLIDMSLGGILGQKVRGRRRLAPPAASAACMAAAADVERLATRWRDPTRGDDILSS
jgi:hypothetical protein